MVKQDLRFRIGAPKYIFDILPVEQRVRIVVAKSRRRLLADVIMLSSDKRIDAHSEREV